MFKTFLFSLVLCFFLPFKLISQVVENNLDEQELENTSYSDDEVYFSIEPAYSYRLVEVNPKFLTGNVEALENEESVVLTSFTLGLRKNVSDNLIFDIGFGYSRNGESYNYESTDSLYEYSNTYRHLSFPVKLAFSSGEKLSWYFGVGLTPKAFLSLKSDLRYSNAFSSFVQEEEIVTRDGYNLFVVDASASIGVRFPLGDNAGLHLFTIGDYQLNNTYDSMSTIIRKAYRIGGAIGFYFKLQ
jgi:hypothetical protein